MKRACGLDVHKDNVFVCMLDEKGEKLFEMKSGVNTPELDTLRQILIDKGVGQIAMESTSIYWMPIWQVLSSDFELKLANPLFLKQLAGRKSDVKDACWIAEALQKNLIRGSYVPESKVGEMRQYERRYRYLSKRIVHVEQRIDMQLQRCNIRFGNYVSDIGSKSMRKVIKRLIAGERDPEKLCALVHGRIINNHGKQTITDSLSGVIHQSDVDMLEQCMEELELLEKQQQQVIKTLEELAEQHFATEISLLCTIPGIKKLSAIIILAELGGNMEMFPKAYNLIGWAGLKPRNEESNGKFKSRKIMHGNKYLRIALVECAWAACRKKQGFLGEKYRQLSKRMKSQKALIAIARKLLVIIWNVLSKKEPFDHSRNFSTKTTKSILS